MLDWTSTHVTAMSKTEDFPTFAEDQSQEIDLLDLLLVIAENLKLLIFLPFLAGLCAWGISHLVPQTFESTSILQPKKPGIEIPGQVIASYIKSADTLNLVAEELNFQPTLSGSQRIRALQEEITVTVGKQDQLVTLTTRGTSPEMAKVLSETIWKHVLPQTAPRGSELERLKEQISSEEQRLTAGKKLETTTAALLEQGTTNESTARLYGELLASNSERQTHISALIAQLEGLSVDDLAQRPTLAEEPIAPKKSLIALAAAIATGFLMLVFVFTRHALRSASQLPEQQEKIVRLRNALRIK